MPKLPKITSLQNVCDVSRMKWWIKLNFCVGENQSFYKLVLSFLMSIARHALSTQSNKYAVSLQYLKKELS